MASDKRTKRLVAQIDATKKKLEKARAVGKDTNRISDLEKVLNLYQTEINKEDE